MAILKVFGVIVSFLSWAAIEATFLRYQPTLNLLRVVLGNFVAVIVLCLTWNGFTLRCLGEIGFLTSMGITFRLVTEYVNEMLEGKRGLLLALIAGHFAAVGVALVWYGFLLLFATIFG